MLVLMFEDFGLESIEQSFFLLNHNLLSKTGINDRDKCLWESYSVWNQLKRVSVQAVF